MYVIQNIRNIRNIRNMFMDIGRQDHDMVDTKCMSFSECGINDKAIETLNVGCVREYISAGNVGDIDVWSICVCVDVCLAHVC